MKKKWSGLLLLFLGLLVSWPTKAAAVNLDEVTTTLNKLAGNSGGSPDSIKMLVLMTVLTLIPMLLILTTSFTRIIMALSFVRSSLGTQQTPPNQVLTGIALFLTFFIMQPVFSVINETAIQPLMSDQITQGEALKLAEKPLKEFMLAETREKDLALFVKQSGKEKLEDPSEAPLTVVVPAFLISELRTAFSIGFLIFIPFLIIDMAVASILMSMGMFMLSPVMISLPFKLLLFVLVDGWYLVVESLVRGFS